jgi:FkbM family methyltransferase
MRLLTLKNGEQIYAHNKGEYISDFIQQTRWYYEPKTIEYIKNIGLKDCNILDIGANVGNHTIAISKVTNNCAIISFEPFESNYKILKHNQILHSNNNIQTYQYFVTSKENSEDTFYINPVWGECNLGYIKESDSCGQEVINHYIDLFKYSNLKLIKIDVEGLELDVLKGSIETIGEHKPIIIAEHHNIEEHYQVLEYLKQFGYKLETIIQEDNLNYVYTV